MSALLRRTSKIISNRLGSDSFIINTVRPLYEGFLTFSYGSRGLVQTVNGCEEFRIDPHYRMLFPEVYDPNVCAFLRARVRPGDISLNIGAHVGLYALCLAHWSRPDGQVFAFEPNPDTRVALEKHVSLNGCLSQIRIIPKAVSDSPGELPFFATNLEGYSRLGQPNPHTAHKNVSAITVPVTSIDSFCAEQAIKPDWITIDIEGYEAAALNGARDIIKAGQGQLYIIAEMHPNLWSVTGTSRSQIESLLNELSLRPIALTGQTDPLGQYGIVYFQYV